MSKSKQCNEKVNATIRKKQICVDLAKWLHASCISPPVSTFTKAINNNHFTTCPSLSSQLILKHVPKSIHTYQGHLKSECQGLQFTPIVNAVSHNYQDYFPISDQPNVRSNQVCYALINPSSSVTGYMDLTGRLPKRSSRGNECILLGHRYYSNYVEGIPTKNRKGPTIAASWKLLYNTFKKSVIAPQTFVLINKISKNTVNK